MKRSEMLEEIRKILAMNGKDNGMGELEEALLHTVESIGMLPPFNEFVDCGYTMRRFGWEPEE